MGLLRGDARPGAAYPWEFTRAGKITQFEPTKPLSLDDQDLMVEAALSGAALAIGSL